MTKKKAKTKETPEEKAAEKKAQEILKKLAQAQAKEHNAEWQQFVEETVKKMGRPSVYDPKYCDDVIRYFLTKPPYVTVSTMFGPKLVANDLPTKAEFAVRCGVSRDTINEWERVHPEFSDAVKKAVAVQEWIWATNTMHKLYDKTFAIFFGKNNLGYVDEVVQKVKDERDPVKSLAEQLFARVRGAADTGANAPSSDPGPAGSTPPGSDGAVPSVLPPGAGPDSVPVSAENSKGVPVESSGEESGRVHQDSETGGQDGGNHPAAEVPADLPAPLPGPAADGGDRQPERGTGEDGRGPSEERHPETQGAVGAGGPGE